MKIIFYTFLSLVLAAFLFIAISIMGIIKYTKDLPDYKQLKEYSPSIISRLYTGNGSPLAEFSLQKRIFIPTSSMPDMVKKAFVSAEDKNFFQHKGVDLISIAKAFVININNIYNGRRLVGASTITQQVAKNFLLSNEVSLNRKIKEALLALRIERILTKERILELYLNEIFLGLRSYGIAAASLNYFNKSLDELELSEIAYLAGLPKGPNNYHPIKNKKAAIIRRNYVLNRMKEDGIISQEAAIKASLKPIEQTSKKEEERVYAPYFIEEVRRKIVDNYGEDALYKEGLNIITTIDPILQTHAIDSLRKGIEEYDKRHGWRGPVRNIKEEVVNKKSKNLKEKYKNFPGLHSKKLGYILQINDKELTIKLLEANKKVKIYKENIIKQKWLNKSNNFNFDQINKNFKKYDLLVINEINDNHNKIYEIDQIPEVNGAIVVIDPRNGRVLALSGGYDFDGSEFNRATQAKRQPGSAFKPFVYLAALENGYLPNTKILDAPLVIDQGPQLGDWRPKNYSGVFYGPSTLRVGLEKSRNVMTVRLANQIGMKKITEIGKRFKLGNFPPLLATSLGAEEVTLLDLVAAYATFVNGGRYNKPAIIEKIQDRKGKTIFRRDERFCKKCQIIQEKNFIRPLLAPEGEQIIDESFAFQLTWMLKGVTERGTAKSLKNLRHTLAGKTGTTNDNMDAWFLGFSPEIVVGVFIGFDQPKTLGDKETGGKVAVPIFADFLTKALKNLEKRPFLVPENIEMVKIEHNSGKFVIADSKKTIYEAFLKGTINTEKDKKYINKEVIKGFEDNLY